VSPVTQAACTTGATLPSIVPLPDGSSALVAWYETPIASRSDPIQSCSAALAAPLQIAVVSGASSASPSLGMPTTLTSEGVSLRPPAMTAIQGASQVLVAAPDGTAVSVWALASAQSPGSPTSVPGLAGARAVSMAAANDGSDRVAIVAELGCAPQSIALALGSLSGGFGQVTTVVPAGSAAAVQPTVAWVPSQGYWIVSWIAAGGGARALAQRFDSGGNAVGGVVDPSASAIAACAQADGSILAYEPGASGGGFVRTSLGCAQ
jgi:hypothetical protein